MSASSRTVVLWPGSRRVFSAFLVGSLALAACGDGEEEPRPEVVPEEVRPEPAPEDSPVIPLTPDTPRADTPAVDTLPSPPAPDPEEDPGPTTRTEVGVLGVTGTAVAPTATLSVDDGPTLGLTGDLARELRRLAGARVRVEGRPTATPVGPGIEVTTYRILEIDGREPLVGTVREEEGRWLLVPEEGESVILEGMPTTRIADGMKIWVVGEPGPEGRFRVESYGVVAPAGP